LTTATFVCPTTAGLHNADKTNVTPHTYRNIILLLQKSISRQRRTGIVAHAALGTRPGDSPFFLRKGRPAAWRRHAWPQTACKL